jgi:hypothetical protein
MDSAKINALDNIGNIAKGYDFYLQSLQANRKVLVPYLIGKQRFENVSDSLFDFFNNNQVTYKMILNAISKLEKFNKMYNQLNAENEKIKADSIHINCKNWSQFNNISLKMFNIPGL